MPNERLRGKWQKWMARNTNLNNMLHRSGYSRGAVLEGIDAGGRLLIHR